MLQHNIVAEREIENMEYNYNQEEIIRQLKEKIQEMVNDKNVIKCYHDSMVARVALSKMLTLLVPYCKDVLVSIIFPEIWDSTNWEEKPVDKEIEEIVEDLSDMEVEEI